MSSKFDFLSTQSFDVFNLSRQPIPLKSPQSWWLLASMEVSHEKMSGLVWFETNCSLLSSCLARGGRASGWSRWRTARGCCRAARSPRTSRRTMPRGEAWARGSAAVAGSSSSSSTKATRTRTTRARATTTAPATRWLRRRGSVPELFTFCFLFSCTRVVFKIQNFNLIFEDIDEIFEMQTIFFVFQKKLSLSKLKQIEFLKLSVYLNKNISIKTTKIRRYSTSVQLFNQKSKV